MSRPTGWSVLFLLSAFASADQVTVERDARMSTQQLEKVAPLQGLPAFRADGADDRAPMKRPIARNELQDPRKTLNGAHRV